MINPTSAEIKTQSDINKLVLGYYNSRREVMVGYLGGMNPESKPHTANSTISWAKASTLLDLAETFSITGDRFRRTVRHYIAN